MSKEPNQFIEPESNRSFFAMIPGAIGFMDLDPKEHRLLTHYIQTASNRGDSDNSVRVTAERTGLTTKRVTSCRDQLEEKLLIYTNKQLLTPKNYSAGATIKVTPRDLWKLNAAFLEIIQRVKKLDLVKARAWIEDELKKDTVNPYLQKKPPIHLGWIDSPPIPAQVDQLGWNESLQGYYHIQTIQIACLIQMLAIGWIGEHEYIEKLDQDELTRLLLWMAHAHLIGDDLNNQVGYARTNYQNNNHFPTSIHQRNKAVEIAKQQANDSASQEI